MAEFGLDNLTASNSTGAGFSDTTELFSDTIAPEIFGSNIIIGIFILALFGIVLWKSDVSMDTSATVMIPTITFLGMHGYLGSYGSGIVYGLILGIGGIFAFGLMKFKSG